MTTQPPPSARAEFEALLAELRAAQAVVGMAYGWHVRRNVVRYWQACEALALYVQSHGVPLDTDAPAALPDDWQPSPELGD